MGLVIPSFAECVNSHDAKALDKRAGMNQHSSIDIKDGDIMDSIRKKEIMDYMADQDVSFVRLAFCDIFGQLKNTSISVSSLEKALDKGIGFNASAIRGFMNVEDSDLLLFPDPSTLTILPWRPVQGKVARFFCTIKHSDGRPFEGDARHFLKQYEKSLLSENIGIQIGSEVEFYLFKQDDEGNPTDIPMDRGSYFDIAPRDKGEDIRREICLTMEQMGIAYEASHHEKGPGQNEVRLQSSMLLEGADALISFKDLVKVIANRMGLFASFLPKPLFNENGSGLTINISLSNGDEAKRRAMIGGILRRIEEITIFLNPVANSYERKGTFEAPSAIDYGYGNKKFLIKVPQANADTFRIKVRSADPSCNPYLAILLLVGAAVEGIRDNVNPDDYCTGKELPDTLIEAVRAAEQSSFVRTLIPDHLFERFLQAKREDWQTSSLSGDPQHKAKSMEFSVT